MKKIIVVTTFLAITTNCFCQQTDPSRTLAKTTYLQKSKNQKTTAWVLVGGGVALAITGTIIHDNAYNQAMEDDPWVTTLSLGTNVNPTGAIIATTGFLAAVASIPFFVASGKNKKRANAISTAIKMETIPGIQRASIVKRSYPAVAINIRL